MDPGKSQDGPNNPIRNRIWNQALFPTQGCSWELPGSLHLPVCVTMKDSRDAIRPSKPMKLAESSWELLEISGTLLVVPGNLHMYLCIAANSWRLRRLQGHYSCCCQNHNYK